MLWRSPLLALTYGVRQPSVTADPLTYRIGLGVGLRNIPADILDPVWHSIVNFLDLNARQQVHLSFLPPAERSPPSAVSWPASLTPNVLPKRVGEVTFVLVPNDGTQVAASAGEAGC